MNSKPTQAITPPARHQIIIGFRQPRTRPTTSFLSIVDTHDLKFFVTPDSSVYTTQNFAQAPSDPSLCMHDVTKLIRCLIDRERSKHGQLDVL